MANARVRRARKKQAERRLKQLEKTGHVPNEVMPVGPIAELPEDDLALILMDAPERVSASRAIGQSDYTTSLNNPFFDPLEH